MKRIRTPTVIQMEAAECGAAALAIVLGYYGRYATLEELRYQCGVSRNGCNAFNVVEAARHYGLEAEGFRLEVEEVPNLPLPCILHWQEHHFVVLEGFSSKEARINDPATGPRKISRDLFERNFSRVALTFRPGPDFVKAGQPPSFWRALTERIAPVGWMTIGFLMLLQLTLVFINLFPPGLSRAFLDNVLGQKLVEWKWPLLTLLSLVLVMHAGATFLQNWIVLRLSYFLNLALSTRFLNHILKLPLLFFSQRYGAEIVNRINLNFSVSQAITGQVVVTSINVLLILVYGFVMLRYDAVIAMLGLSAMLVSALLYMALARARADNYSRLQQEQARSIGISIDALQHMETIKAAGSEPFCFSRVFGYQTKNINNLQEIGRKDIWLNSGAAFVNQIANVALLGVGCWRVMEGHLSLGMLLALQMLLGLFLGPVSQLIGFSMQTQTLKIDMQRLDDVLKNRADPQLGAFRKKGQKGKLRGEVELSRITFGYNPLDEPLLDNLSLKIEPGTRVALVGRTASGKTTVAKLLCGLFTPWKGILKYDGIPFADLTQEQMKGALGWVDQDIFIVSGTVRDNITLWNPAVPGEEIVRAAKDACIHEEILAMTQGYDALLIEGGNNISQGQKQRLEIARALVSNPSLLVMDEATSALDSQTEADIFHNIWRRGCTCILIAHRLSTVKDCDRIVVLEKGRIVQQGTHDDLKTAEGLYRNVLLSGGDEQFI